MYLFNKNTLYITKFERRFFYIMKKNIAITLILASVFFSSFALIPTFAATTFHEGVYQLSNLNVTQKNRYTVQNISPDNSVY